MAPTKSGKGNTTNIDESDLEILINKVCTQFVNQLEQKFDQKLEKLDKNVIELSNSIKNLNKMVTSNNNAIESIMAKCDILEQRGKRNALRINGIPEKEGEVVPNIVISLITNTLKLTCTEQDIDSAFRIGKAIGEQGTRTILVNFVSNIKRTQVFNAKKLLKKSNITMYEDLTQERYELLMAAKKKYGSDKAWSAGGKVYVICNSENKKVLIKSKNEL